MTESNPPDHRQAKNVAVFGFILSLVSFLTLIALSLWSKSDSLAALARFVAIGLPIWFILYLVLKQLRRVTAEQLETAELKRAQAGAGREGIFDVDDESLLIEQNRLRWMTKWLLPAITVILFAYLLIGHFIGWGWSFDDTFSETGMRRTEQGMLMMWFVVGIGFANFLYARYSIALAKMPHWRLLRAGATVMAGTALACLGLATALAASKALEWGWAEPLFGYVLRVVMIVLGIELVANFILDFYRPRTPGFLSRPSFDSRTLGLIGEPGGIAKSIADAINYQFGFEVSSTWFYQLLQRWMFPIMVFTFVVVLSLSSIVIVDADELAMVERFGKLTGDGNEVLEPGIHFKWPFPIDVVNRAPVKRIREVVIGEATKDADKDIKKAILWTQPHEFVPELMLLVGFPKATPLSEFGLPGKSNDSDSVAVSLVLVSVPIEYRIKDVKKYLYNYTDPEKLLKALAYQFLTDYGAGVGLDVLMGPGRDEINRELQASLQERLDEKNTGIEIVFAGIRGAHPSPKNGVAEAFLQVITSQTTKSALINAAQGEARKILTAVAGTETRARTLDEAIREQNRLQADTEADPEALAAADEKVEDLLMGNTEKGIPPLSGQVAVVIAEARARASDLVSQAAAKVRVFNTEVAAYTAAPNLYLQRKDLEKWEGLEAVRKYLIVGDPANVIIEYETEQKGGLDQVLMENP